jgi:hypothetical protein
MIKTKIKSILEAIINSDMLKILSMGLILVIITFPFLDFSFDIGIDPPLAWAFNYLFDHDLKLGQHIIFPHGPLAFLMYPTYNNALVGMLVNILVQIILVYSIAVLLKKYKNTRWLILFVISFFLLKQLPLNHLILLIILCSFLNYFETGKTHFKIIAILLTAFSIYIKAYVAIIAGLMIFSFLLVEYYRFRDWKKALLTISIGISATLIIWFAMYKSFSGMINYFVGMLNLAQDNSAAAAYHPANNWFCLAGFLIIISFLPFIQKDKKGKLFASLFLFSFFGAWKHGIAREDIYHMNGLLFYAMASMVIFVVYIRKNYFLNLTLLAIAFSLFYINLENAISYNRKYTEFTGINNFKNAISDFHSIIEQSKKTTKQNIAIYTLPERILNKIGTKTVDAYPWDYSIIAANNLNWQPRVVLHSYAAYTSWLDKQDAKHFESDKAPEYLLWHLGTSPKGLGRLNSIDWRYLLNDEPNTILEIIKNYELTDNTPSILVYKKRKEALTSNSSCEKALLSSWDEWIDVPETGNNILRLKLNIQGNIKRKVKSFFYKDEAFFIYYKLADESIISYKIVPKNASDGLWINPFIQYPLNNFCEQKVKQVMIRCSNKSLLKQTIAIQWEYFTFNNEKDNSGSYVLTFFGKSNICTDRDSLILESTNSFEQEVPFWTYRPKTYANDIIFSGNNSLKLEPKMFSPTFKFKMDSLPLGKLNISANASIHAKQKADASMVISIEDENGALFWEAENINRFVIDNKAWNYMSHEVSFMNTHQNDAILKIYFWNTGNSIVMLDDFRVRIGSLSD